MSKKFDFKWRKAKASAPVPKDETARARTSEARVQPLPATKEARAVLAPAAEKPRQSYDQIAVRAFELWEAQGSPEGADLRNWLDAERQLRSEPR